MTVEQLLGILAAGVKKGASDIHLQVGYPPTFRVRGSLYGAKLAALTAGDTQALAWHILGKDNPISKGLKYDVDRSFSIKGVARFRASIFQQRGSLGLVLRVIPLEIPTLGELGLPAAIESIGWARNGLVLVTGATGNGKSTTIASLLDHVNKTSRLHVVMIEDPSEYQLSPAMSVVVQREIGRDAETYSSALRAALRQDPDVIMVGELRDHETADTCLKAAETGHLVITSLHTPDVQRTIGRFTALFAPEEQQAVRNRLADNLRTIVSQRLVERADGQGLVAAVEILMVTRSVQAAIRDPAKIDSLWELMQKGRDDVGMQTFDQHLLELFRSATISADTAKQNATRRSEIERDLMMSDT